MIDLFRKRHSWIVLDIDGVLADCTHRLKYIQKKQKDYDTFFSEIPNDTPIQDKDFIKNIIKSYKGRLAIMTGRPWRTQEDTINWLYDNYDLNGVAFTLYMRLDSDHRPSPKAKADLIKELVNDYGNIRNIMVVDDMKDNVVAMTDAAAAAGIPNAVGAVIDGKAEEESK